MLFDKKSIAEIINLANSNSWDTDIPKVSMKLRIAVNSLNGNSNGLWALTPEEFYKRLEMNQTALNIVRNVNKESFAFAIRDSRLSRR